MKRNILQLLQIFLGAAALAATDEGTLLKPVDQVPSTTCEAPEETWTLVALPDTQGYTEEFPEVFQRQTEWIAANKDRLNIRFVAHLGDVTENNIPQEWEVARKAMGTLVEAGVPFCLPTGNHDLRTNKKMEKRRTILNDFFKPSDYRNSEEAGFFQEGELENSWHAISTPAGKFLIVALEFGPRDEVLAWANEVISNHPDHQVLVVTHSYLYHDDTRYDWPVYGEKQKASPHRYAFAKEKEGAANDGEEMWKKLVSKHPNIRMVLCGHVLGDGTGYLISKGEKGNEVHQLLSNYQKGVKPDRGYRGGGFLRIIQFLPDGKTVRVKTYSPWYDQWLKDPDQEFEIRL